jgi:hypothetical protein
MCQKTLAYEMEKTDVRWERTFSGSTMASFSEDSDTPTAEHELVSCYSEPEPPNLEPEVAALLLPGLRRMRHGAEPEERRRLSKEIANLEGILGITNPVPDPVPNLFRSKADVDSKQSLETDFIRKTSKEATAHNDPPEPVSDQAAELLLPGLKRIRSHSLSWEERSRLNGEIQGLEEKLGIQTPSPDPESWVVKPRALVSASNPTQEN